MDWTRSLRPLAAKTTGFLACLALVLTAQLASAQSDRDFVFNDEDGLLILRFVGAGSELSPNQRDEIVNQEFSQMVHDRLRADLRFDVETRDSAWAEPVEHRLDSYLREQAPEFSTFTVECRSASCRIVLEHSSTLSIVEHQRLMTSVQRTLQEFIEIEPAGFEPVFLMSAFDQGDDLPHIKAFLRRVDDHLRPY